MTEQQCYKCKKVGQIAQNCDQQQIQQVEHQVWSISAAQHPRVEALICRCRTQAIINTGASVSILPNIVFAATTGERTVFKTRTYS